MNDLLFIYLLFCSKIVSLYLKMIHSLTYDYSSTSLNIICNVRCSIFKLTFLVMRWKPRVYGSVIGCSLFYLLVCSYCFLSGLTCAGVFTIVTFWENIYKFTIQCFMITQWEQIQFAVGFPLRSGYIYSFHGNLIRFN